MQAQKPYRRTERWGYQKMVSAQASGASSLMVTPAQRGSCRRRPRSGLEQNLAVPGDEVYPDHDEREVHRELRMNGHGLFRLVSNAQEMSASVNKPISTGQASGLMNMPTQAYTPSPPSSSL